VYVSGFAVHLLCLPSTVAASGAGAQAVSAAMVGLGIVHHLQSQGLIALIDEPMWRCVLSVFVGLSDSTVNECLCSQS
jgi:hypothetical protein